MAAGQALKGHLDLLLLAILEDEQLHGYAVIEALRERSSGEFDLPEGTVYPALHRLEQERLLASRWSDASGRRRRVPKGRGNVRESFPFGAGAVPTPCFTRRREEREAAKGAERHLPEGATF